MPVLEKENAVKFFSEFYFGEHHIPGELKEWRQGWMVVHNRGGLATFDFNQLTRLVFMAHRDAIRVEIIPHTFSAIKICLHQRTREGSISLSHPDIYDALNKFIPNLIPGD